MSVIKQNEQFKSFIVIIIKIGVKIMDKLTDLIKEAKPLYKQRKRRRAIARTMLSICVPAFVFTSLLGLCLEGNNIYVALHNDTLQHELLNDDFGLYGI